MRRRDASGAMPQAWPRWIQTSRTAPARRGPGAAFAGCRRTAARLRRPGAGGRRRRPHGARAVRGVATARRAVWHRAGPPGRSDPRGARGPGRHADVVTDAADTPAEPVEKRVSWAELFFDLVFVFAVTEVSTLLAADHSSAGALRALVVFVPIYWAWVGVAVQTNVGTCRPRRCASRCSRSRWPGCSWRSPSLTPTAIAPSCSPSRTGPLAWCWGSPCSPAKGGGSTRTR